MKDMKEWDWGLAESLVNVAMVLAVVGCGVSLVLLALPLFADLF